MQQSNAMTVKQALEEAALRTGVPRLIVSDEGGDVRGGIEQYCGDHPQTSSTCDMAHKGANLLRKLLEGDQRWPEFVAQLGQTKGKLQQTALAWCVGPSLRPKARFMNLGAPLRWARWCLRVLDQPWPPSAALSDRQRAVLTKIDREQLEAKLGWLRDYREAIEQWSQWHEVIQVVVRQVRRCGIGAGRRQRDAHLRQAACDGCPPPRRTSDRQYGDLGIALWRAEDPGATAGRKRPDRFDAGVGRHRVHLDRRGNHQGVGGDTMEGSASLDRRTRWPNGPIATPNPASDLHRDVTKLG